MPEKTTNAANGMSNLVGFEAVLQMQRPAFTALAEMHGRLYESIATVTGNGLRSSTGNSRKTWRYQSGFQELTKLTGLIAENAIQSAARQGPTKRDETRHY